MDPAITDLKRLLPTLNQPTTKCVYINLPYYSPELKIWNHAKRRTGKMPIANKAQMKDAALKVLRSIQKTTALIKSFFQLKTTQYVAQ